jgi:hypothetical protein
VNMHFLWLMKVVSRNATGIEDLIKNVIQGEDKWMRLSESVVILSRKFSTTGWASSANSIISFTEPVMNVVPDLLHVD